MHDRINELLGWDAEMQTAISELSKGDFSLLMYAANPKYEDGEDETTPYRTPPSIRCLTSEGSPNHRLFAILSRKGWMVDTTGKLDEALKGSGSKQYSWTQKGFRLVPQLLIKCAIEGNWPTDSGKAPQEGG